MGAWLTFLEMCCDKYQVDRNFALAVFKIESGTQEEPLRFGPLGKGTYYGPAGIHRDFLNKWRVDNAYVNTWVGVRALRGKDKRRVLRRYNPQADDAYLKAVFAEYARLRKCTVKIP